MRLTEHLSLSALRNDFFFLAFNIVTGNMYHFWVQELISVKVVYKSSTGPFPGDAGVKK